MERIYHDAPQGESTYIEIKDARRDAQGDSEINLDAQMKEEIKNRYVIHQGVE